MPKNYTLAETIDEISAVVSANAKDVAKATQAAETARDETVAMLEKAEKAIDGLLANGTFSARGSGAGGAERLARAFTESEQYKAFQNGAPSTGRVMLSGDIASMRNAAGPITSDTGGYETAAGWSPRLGGLAMRRLQLLRALPSIPVEVGSYVYNQVPSYVNAATEQAGQGAQKAQADVEPVAITAAIPTIAHWIPLALQVVQDSPALVPILANLLAYGTSARLENQIVNGAGGANTIHGLLPQATAYASTFTSGIDMIGDAISELDDLGWSPSLVCLNPKDWFAMQATKSAGSEEYVLGFPGAATAPSLWGVPVAGVPSLAAGTALVLDTSQLAILDRLQPSVMLSREHGTNFTQNLVTALAELRAGLMVLSPASVLKVALPA